jgi:glycerate kinase
MTTRDQEEQDLRIDLMTINIEKLRADLAAQQKQLEWETRKFVVQIIAGFGAAAGGGAALLALILHWTGKL